MKIETRRLDLVTISILVIIPLVCIIVFMLPVETQRTLQVYTTVFSPVNFITAIFVHGDLQHLVGNVVVFILVGCLTYFLNKKAKRDRFLLISLLTILFVLPLVYYPLLLLLNHLIFHLELASFGLSLTVSGLIGYIIPSLTVFLGRIPDLNINQTRFFLSTVFLTGMMIVFPYVGSNFYNIAVFSATIVLAFSVGLNEFSEILKFSRTNTRNRKWAFAIFLILLLYLLLLAFLFPSEIVQSSGFVVDILAHYFGIFFGLIVPSLILKPWGSRENMLSGVELNRLTRNEPNSR